MSNWAYVAIAYTIAWGALAIYALVLARRVVQAREVARELSEAVDAGERVEEQDSALCDVPPAP